MPVDGSKMERDWSSCVLAGHLDGVVSRSTDADMFLPDLVSNLIGLICNFRSKNFTVEELILSGRKT
ncbi:hypothetical protein E2562_008363 [Oryza meyeriana var. granulata]|uniref:Uncharacterized protein n=1 Tax=Oryza meyeriana var. granulata TaxID=110450 RepID=A0A6G1EGY9_9ORYZ|nr:hypothetical protein E2562_008363 [Oryza meyeriana var. granulata]